MKNTKAKTAVTFTKEEKEVIANAAYAAFSDCAYDMLSAIAEEGRDTISRAEAMEVGLDADRAATILRGDMRRARAAGKPTVVTEDLLRRMEAATYDQLLRIARSRFTFARYGA